MSSVEVSDDSSIALLSLRYRRRYIRRLLKLKNDVMDALLAGCLWALLSSRCLVPSRTALRRGSVGCLVGAPNPGPLVGPDASSGSQELFAIAARCAASSLCIGASAAVWPYRGHAAEGGRPCVSLGAVPPSCGLGVCGRCVPTVSNQYRFLMNSHWWIDVCRRKWTLTRHTYTTRDKDLEYIHLENSFLDLALERNLDFDRDLNGRSCLRSCSRTGFGTSLKKPLGHPLLLFLVWLMALLVKFIVQKKLGRHWTLLWQVLKFTAWKCAHGTSPQPMQSQIIAPREFSPPVFFRLIILQNSTILVISITTHFPKSIIHRSVSDQSIDNSGKAPPYSWSASSKTPYANIRHNRTKKWQNR